MGHFFIQSKEGNRVQMPCNVTELKNWGISWNKQLSAETKSTRNRIGITGMPWSKTADHQSKVLHKTGLDVERWLWSKNTLLLLLLFLLLFVESSRLFLWSTCKQIKYCLFVALKKAYLPTRRTIYCVSLTFLRPELFLRVFERLLFLCLFCCCCSKRWQSARC